MKTLSNYTEQAISEALSKHGAFFAFSQSQFEEQAVPGLRYCSLGSGLICPEKNALLLSSDLEVVNCFHFSVSLGYKTTILSITVNSFRL